MAEVIAIVVAILPVVNKSMSVLYDSLQVGMVYLMILKHAPKY